MASQFENDKKNSTVKLVTAEYGIRQLHARCVDAVWRKDVDSFKDCFVAGGEWKIAGFHFRGKADIGEGLARFLGVNERVLLMIGTPVLSIENGTVSGRSKVYELVKRLDGSGISTIGTYYERFEEHNGQWLFTWRHFDLHYSGPADLSAAFALDADYGPPPAMPAVDAPTYYPD